MNISNLETSRYIIKSDLLEEIADFKRNIDIVQHNIVKMKQDLSKANAQGYQKVVDACESTLEDLRYEESERATDLIKLVELRQTIEQYNPNEDPPIINEDHFEAHLRDWSMDVYGVDIDAFPFCYIDWETARESLLIQDYATIEFDHEKFYVKVA